MWAWLLPLDPAIPWLDRWERLDGGNSRIVFRGAHSHPHMHQFCPVTALRCKGPSALIGYWHPPTQATVSSFQLIAGQRDAPRKGACLLAPSHQVATASHLE